MISHCDWMTYQLEKKVRKPERLLQRVIWPEYREADLLFTVMPKSGDCEKVSPSRSVVPPQPFYIKVYLGQGA